MLKMSEKRNKMKMEHRNMGKKELQKLINALPYHLI